MTIFINAAKILMIQSLDKSMAEANAKDQSYLGGWRNSALSGEQRDKTLLLRRQIEDFKELSSDIDSLAALKKLISTMDANVEQIRRKHKETRGNLNNTLITLNGNLERFYYTLDGLSFKLTDIENDNKPFHILCANAAYYFGENIFPPPDEGMVAKTVSAVVGSTPVEIREAKEACLLRHLTECHKKLSALRDDPEFDSMRKDFVVAEVEAIQRDNAQICKDAQIIHAIPVSLAFFATASVTAPKMRPSRGRLEVCMQNVLKAIEEASATPAADHSM